MKMSYLPELCTNKNKTEVELDLFYYVVKYDLKKATGNHTSQFAKKDDLAKLKSEVYE